MKTERINYKYAVFFLILLNLIIFCNTSYVHAVEDVAPTECRLNINNNALYTNNRYVTLELYGVDESAMQVWISNDGEYGTVVDFEYNKTISITDTNYAVGTPLTASNSTTTTNSNNVLRIENWPLSSINGSKKVYAVFRDAYGNITPITGLTTINVSYRLNGNIGDIPETTQTVKRLGVYIPGLESPSMFYSFKGWSTSQTATIPNYYADTIAAFDSDTTLYAVCNTIKEGDYVYYPVDLGNSYTVVTGKTGVSDASPNFSMADKFSANPTPVFRVLEVDEAEEKIVLCPSDTSQVYQLQLFGDVGYTNGPNIIRSACAIYDNEYSSSSDCITYAQISKHLTTDGLSTFFSNSSWIDKNWTRGYNGDQYPNARARFANINGESDIWLIDTSRNQKLVTYYITPAITLEPTTRLSGAGTRENPYTLYSIGTTVIPVNVGDYVYYPVDLTKSYTATTTVTDAVNEQTFEMDSIFSSSPALFRVLSVSSTQVTLCPSDLSQTFNITIGGKTAPGKLAVDNGRTAIEELCKIYSTEYSASTSCVTQAQMANVSGIEGFGSLFANEFWITSGWFYGFNDVKGSSYGKIANSVRESYVGFGAIDENGPSALAQTHRVLPTIKLKRTLNYTGEGTPQNPYTLSF